MPGLITRPLRYVFGLGTFGLTATSAMVVIAFDLALAGLGWTYCLAGRLWPGFYFTVEFGNDKVGAKICLRSIRSSPLVFRLRSRIGTQSFRHLPTVN